MLPCIIPTILAIFVTAIIVYSLLDNYVDTEDKNVPLYAFISLICGIIVSILVSYLTLEPDDLMTADYWTE